MIDAIRCRGRRAECESPQLRMAISAEELLQLQRTRLFEVFNGHPTVNNFGGGGVPGLEEVWDRMLSSGKLLYGIAVDDAHYFKRPEDKTAPRPGQGWVYVQAPRLESRALLEALERGDFYSSTGVELQSLTATSTTLTVAVKTEPQSKYRIQFIGKQGSVLSEALSSPATYTFKGDSPRAREVIESNGKPPGSAGSGRALPEINDVVVRLIERDGSFSDAAPRGRTRWSWEFPAERSRKETHAERCARNFRLDACAVGELVQPLRRLLKGRSSCSFKSATEGEAKQ